VQNNRLLRFDQLLSPFLIHLHGKKLDETIAAQAGEIALEGAKPLKDNIYKVKMAQDLLHRGLLASV
jgi:CO/xanthine dehydrogenase FAD-binding subunit